MADEGGQGGESTGTETTETTEDTAPANPAMSVLTDETKVEAIGKVLRSRQTFPTLAEAIAKLEAAGKDTESFYGLPIGIKGMDPDSGEIDEAMYDGAIVVLSTVGARIDAGKGKKVSGLKAIAIYPMPTVESFLSDDMGKAWVAKLIEKESDLVSKRSYRDAATLTEFLNGISKAPGTVAEYVAESKRSGSALDTETFDALWSGLRAGLKEDQPALAKLLPAKGEFLKALRSKSYAESQDNIAPLEAKGIIAKLGQVLIAGAKSNTTKDGTPAPLPTEAIEDWLANRDTVEIRKVERADLDFSALESIDLNF
jgi:hypothetical protein